MIRTSHHGSDLLILRQAKLSSPSSSAKAGCRGIRQSGHAELRTRLPPSINSMPRRSNPLRSRKLKICSTDHAHRIRTAKANSSRRAARTPEHLSHVKVMIILDACDSACDQGCDQLRPGGWPVPMRVVSGGSYRPQLTS